ncbi:MAG: hypothetical protein IJ446_10820 [Oscillospiraceae bacterium]|nr:hypothetical protein [Oscillospiraceae bacterium]MBQ8931836.1 hypothetical protein [Ruminiclostridium sp.]
MSRKNENEYKKESELMKKIVPGNAEEKSQMEDVILNKFCRPQSDCDYTGLVPEGSEADREEAYHKLYPKATPIINDDDSTYGAKGTHSGV